MRWLVRGATEGINLFVGKTKAMEFLFVLGKFGPLSLQSGLSVFVFRCS